MKRQAGFNLMELAVTLALAGLILGIGAPNFFEFRRNNLLTGVANDFLGGILSARSEAMKRQTPVSLCPSDNPTDPDPDCTEGAATGWITFVDADSDCERDAGEDVLRAQGDVDESLEGDADGVCLSFAANGFRQVIAGKPSVVHAMFCDDRGNTPTDADSAVSNARGIEVTPTGRAAITRNLATLEAWDAFGVTCP